MAINYRSEAFYNPNDAVQVGRSAADKFVKQFQDSFAQGQQQNQALAQMSLQNRLNQQNLRESRDYEEKQKNLEHQSEINKLRQTQANKVLGDYLTGKIDATIIDTNTNTEIRPQPHEVYNYALDSFSGNTPKIQMQIKPKSINNINKPIFTVDENGEVVKIGEVPKGAQVMPKPYTIEQKIDKEVESAQRKESKIRESKLVELNKKINFFEQKINEIPGGNGVSGVATGLMQKAGAISGLNTKAKAYQASVDGLKTQIARGLGEVGNLSKTEQDNAVELLPNITDTLDVRNQKIQNFRDFVANSLNKTGTNIINKKTGGVLHQDKHGNKAVVYPDGSYEEVK